MSQSSRYYHIINYGCQMNESDSEHFAGQLQKINYVPTQELPQADVIIINTCCVRESAEKKIYGKIGELKRLKTNRPEIVICIAGCLAQKEGAKLIQKYPHIDLILGTHNITRLTELIQAVQTQHQRQIAIEEDTAVIFDNQVARNNSISAWIPIMYGCNNYCSYCIVPYVRGRERSRPLQEIISEIKQLSQLGYKEVTLLGQNVNSYGKDLPTPIDFADLLTAIDFEAIERIRYMTSHPRDMNEKIIQTIAQGRKICEHFHLPIQAGSDEILQKMNRGYSVQYYKELISMVRQYVPQTSITTDIIVGFPGETDEMFNDTLALVEHIRFDAAYTFLYSPRSGTPAAMLPDQVPLLTKKNRLQQLMDVQNSISLEINKTLVGQTLEVLVEGSSKNDDSKLTGRTRTNKIVIWDNPHPDKINSGQLVNVEINSAQTWLLKGREIESI